MCLASVITNLGMTLIQTRLKIPPPAPLSLSPLLPPRRCPVHCPPHSHPPFVRPPVCAPPSFPCRQGVQQGEPAPAISAASPFTHPPFVQATSRPTGVATPFASPHSSHPPFPPLPFSCKQGCFFGSALIRPVCHWLCKTIICLFCDFPACPSILRLQPTFLHFGQLGLSSALLVSCDFVIALQSPGFHTLDLNLLIPFITPDSVYKPCNYSLYTSSVSFCHFSSVSTCFLYL